MVVVVVVVVVVVIVVTVAVLRGPHHRRRCSRHLLVDAGTSRLLVRDVFLLGFRFVCFLCCYAAVLLIFAGWFVRNSVCHSCTSGSF